ncbi:MAG: cardiolipin synthase [Dinoroseobacter sp.]|nr:cardiolipin synthase [Dinoroseobacter sp.]
MANTLLIVALVILEIVAITFAWRAIKNSRTPQGSVGWVVFLIAAPYLGVPLYLFLGHHRFSGYIVGRKVSEEVLHGVQTYRDRYRPKSDPEVDTTLFEKIGDLPDAAGNGFELLIDGEATFSAVFEAIDNAKSYVLVQSYIVNDDGVGRELADRMIAAAGRGVTVRFMVDAVGSMKLPPSYFGNLRAGGVEFVNPKAAPGPQNRFQLNFRNHRKTIVVDGHIGFTGGLNFGDEYKGLNPRYGEDWRDTHLRLTGPVVSQLQLVFAEDWHWSTEENLIEHLNWDADLDPADMTALIVATGPGDELESGALFFISCIAEAKERVWIASPYFVPDTDILSALKLAALKGLDVRILVPEVIDHKIPWLAAFAYFDEIRAVGVKVMRYNKGFMHQKVVLVDDALAAVGTTNMDNRSFRLNFEAMAVYFDSRAAADLEDMLEADLARSFELTTPLPEQPWKIRVGAPIARLFSPLL